MAEIKNNLIELEVVYSKLNKQIDENISKLQAGAVAVDNYNKKISVVPSEFQKSLTDIKAKTDNVTKSKQNLLEVEKQAITIKSQIAKKTSEEIVNQRALAQASDRQARATSALVGAYANLNAKHQQAKKTLQDLIASQSASSSEIRKAQRDFDLLDKRVISADKAVRSFNRNVGNYPQQAAAGIKNLLSAFGLFGGVYLFASVLRDSFKTVKDFDKANADLAATMGVNRKQIADLTNDQKRLGASTKFTATEVASLQKEFAKLGFSQKEILNATEATLSLAAAVDTDLANAAMVAGSTLRGFGLDASEMGRVTDVMAASFTKSALDIENFRESMKYVAPIAKASGVSIEFTTAMLGKLADAGIKGSQAGTSLRRILAEMAKTGLPAAQALDKIAKSGISVNDAMDEVGRTAQTALLVLSKSKDGINDLASALDNAAGSAKAMADEQLESLQGKLVILSSAWDGFILSLQSSDGLLSRFFKSAIENLTKFLNLITEANKDFKEIQKEIGTSFYSNEQKQVFEFAKMTADIAKERFKTEKEYLDRIRELEVKDAKDRLFRAENVLQELKLKQEDVAFTLNVEEQQSKSIITGGIFNLGDLNRAKKAYEENTLAISNTEQRIQALKDILNGASQIQKQNTEEVDNSTKAVDKNTKAKKEAEIYQIGSVKWLQQQISQLKELNDTLSTTNKEYEVGVGAIKFYEQWLERLTGTAKKAKEELDGVSLDLGGSEFITDEEGDALMKAGNELRALLKEFRQGFIDDFADQSGFGKTLDLLQGGLDKFEGDAISTALAVSEAFQEAFNTIAQASQANFDAEYARLEQQRDFSIEMAGGSATAREEIERQYEERKRAIQRREAEAQKRLAIFNIVTNTAQAILATYAKVGFPAGIPLAIAMGAIGAVQVGLVASQEIPQFWKGTDNAPEGLAWTQEKGAEVITDKSGNVKTLGSNKGAQLTYLQKGDKVYKSHEDYINKVLSKNGVEPLGTYLNIPMQENNSFDMQEMKQEFSKLAKVIKNKEGVNISIDERGFRKAQGNKEFLNARMNLKSRVI